MENALPESDGAMDKVIEAISKVDRVIDQAAIGKARIASNLDLAVKVGQAIRDADLGDDSNRLLDAVIPVVQKLRALVA